MSHALVPVDVASKKSATPDKPAKEPERATTSVVIGPTKKPTSPAPEPIEPVVIRVREGDPAFQDEGPDDGASTPDLGSGTGSPGPAGTTKKKSKKKKKGGRTASSLTYEDLLLPDDLPSIAGLWGLSVGDPRLRVGVAAKESFEFLCGLTLAQRKLLRESDVRAASALSDQDWADRRKDHRVTLTDVDKLELRTLWNMEATEFAEAVKGEPQYQWVRALPDVHRRAATVDDIRKYTELGPETWALRRRAKVSTLTDPDREALAQEWGIPPADPRFAAAIATQTSYLFVLGLEPHNRPAAGVAVITAAKPVKPAEWNRLRRERLATMTDVDRMAMVQSWGLDPDDRRVVAALEDEDKYQFFRSLTKSQREWISWTKFKAKKAPSDDDIEQAKKTAATIAAQEQAKKEKAEREKAAKERRAAGAKQWSEFQADVRERVRKRVEAEMPDFDWAKLVDAALGATGKKIAANPDINVPGQVKDTESAITAGVEREAKRRAVDKAAALVTKKLRALTNIKKDVLADDKLTPTDFDSRVLAAMHDQRNPKTLDTWERWLGLKIYSRGGVPPFKKLAEVGSPTLAAHLTIDWPSLTLPTVTDTTTADDVLNQLFSPTGKNKWDLLHVTLETGIERAPDQLALPHRYWSDIGTTAEYELRYSGGNLRWNPATHNEAGIKKGLDDAYAEMLAALRLKAQHVIDECGPA